MNIGKKLLSLLTVFCLTLSLVPTVALAEETSTNGVATEVKFAKTIYSNYITLDASTPYLASGGMRASSEKPNSGKYAYFHDGILTLNEFTHEKGISATGDLKIELTGTNKIGTATYSDNNGTTPDNDIKVTSGNLTIVGPGSLTLQKAVNTSLYVNGDLTIKDGAQVTAEGGRNGQAIDAKGNIVVDGANTELTATQGYLWAIQADNGSGTITIQNGAKMKVTPNTAKINIKNNKLIVDGTPTTFEPNKEFTSAGKSTFIITLPSGTGYTVSGKTSVNYDESYTFTVTIDRQYRAGSNFSVKVNGVAQTATSGTSYTYTVPNVRENLTIIVEGVEENVLATPDGTGISFVAKSENGGQLTVPNDNFTYQYSVDGGTHWTDAITTTEITGVTTDKGIQVRLKETETGKASGPYTINITKAKAPTDLNGQAPTSSTATDGKITGVDNTMEYQKEGDSSWTSISATTMEGLAPGTYYVRVKATDTTLASDNAIVTIDEYVAPVIKYDIWVAGTQVTSANKDNVLGDSETTHSVVYNPTDKKLTLSGAQIKNTANTNQAGTQQGNIETAGIMSTLDNLTIDVTGNSAISSTNGHAIAAKNLVITATGNNSLQLDSNGNMRAISIDYAETYKYKLAIMGNVAITATVTPKAGGNGGSQADGIVIVAYDISVQDSATLTAKTEGKNWAIYCTGTLAVKNFATLTAKSGGNDQTISAKNFNYPNHSVTASKNYDGSNPAETFEQNQLDTYKYVKVKPIRVTSVTLSESNLPLKTNQTATLTATVNPSDAAVRDVTWASSDTNVARVNAAGATCEVIAIGVGTATITVLTKDGGYTDTCTVTVSNSSSSSGSHTTYYPVNTPAKSEGGSVVVSPKSASKGSAVTVTVTPESGYQVSSVQAVDKDGKKLTLTDKGDGKYTFVMPGSKVEVSASFAQVQKPEEASPYRDVSKDSYYYDAVQWASDKGITNGVSDGVFAPDWVCTRGQIVTFLWRSVGSPAPKTAEMPFADVAEDAYYAQAVLWAVENGITNGTSETTFSPDQTCTRAHAVAFLYRLAGSPAVTGSSFQDVAADAYYNAAVAWAVQQGITNGTSETTFSPDETCTRAQIVTFLYRMDQAK